MIPGRFAVLVTWSVIAFSAHDLRAFPIPPVPLLTLCHRAYTIVVAEVVRFVGPEFGWTDDSFAELRVKTVFKGTAKPDEVLRVVDAHRYPDQCPAPACYPTGGIGIAFLCRDKRDDGFRTVGL